MSGVRAWADGFGVWHVRVPRTAAAPLIVARRALRDALVSRVSNLARSVWKHPVRVPELDTADTIVYREGAVPEPLQRSRRVLRMPTTLAEVLVERVNPCTGHVTDRKLAAMLLRWAREQGCYEEVLADILDRRRTRLLWLTSVQRKWQTKVSHRPGRSRNHDSWSIRETYVRCSNA